LASCPATLACQLLFIQVSRENFLLYSFLTTITLLPGDCFQFVVDVFLHNCCRFLLILSAYLLVVDVCQLGVKLMIGKNMMHGWYFVCW